MSIENFFRALREQWLVVVLAVLVGLVGGLAAFLIRPAEYTADVRLYVSTQTANDTTQAYQGAQLSEQRVTSYNELVTDPRVMRETIRRLGLTESPDELAAQVTASSALNSVIINVSVADRSPERSAAIANTVGTVVTEVVEDLERPTTPNGVAPVAVRVVEPAPVPDKPSSTGLSIVLALGFLAGLVVGIAAALLRFLLDTSVKTSEVLRSTTGVPILGAIAYDSSVPSRPLTVHDEPQSPRSEAFRQLRTNLQFVDVDTPRKVLLVTSSVAAEGKTTTVANLAIALGAAGSRVLVIEADLRRPKLSDLLGMDRSVGLTRVITGRTPLVQAVQPWSSGLFDLLPSGPVPPNPSELLSSNQMRAVLDEAREAYDVVLVDAPPLLPVTDAAAIAPSTDGALLICRYKETTTGQLAGAVAALRAVSVDPLGTVFTMVPMTGPLAYGGYRSAYRSETEEPATQKQAAVQTSGVQAPPQSGLQQAPAPSWMGGPPPGSAPNGAPSYPGPVPRVGSGPPRGNDSAT